MNHLITIDMETTIKCPHCGGETIFNDEQPLCVCPYCDSLLARNISYTKDRQQKEGVRIIKTNHKYRARYELGDAKQRGKVWLTDYELIFKPFKLNEGNTSLRYIPLNEVENVVVMDSEFIFAKLVRIKVKSGNSIHIHVKKKAASVLKHTMMENRKIMLEEGISTSYSLFDKKNDVIKASNVQKYNRSMILKIIIGSSVLLAYAARMGFLNNLDHDIAIWIAPIIILTCLIWMRDSFL